MNEEIDRLRLRPPPRRAADVIVVSSVSCIYGLGEPEDFAKMMVSCGRGTQMERRMLKKLVSIQSATISLLSATCSSAGDGEIFPPTGRTPPSGWEFFGDEIDRLSEINVVGAVIRRLETIPIWPATHYVT